MQLITRRMSRTLAAGILFALLIIAPGLSAVAHNQQMYNKWMILTLILEKIERFYIEEKDSGELLDAALQGVLRELDPHSVYLSAEEYADWKRRYQNRRGIGLKYNRMDGALHVLSLTDDGPALQAGVRLGDRITHIKNQAVLNLDNTAIQTLLTQSADSTLQLTIERPQTSETMTIRVSVESVSPHSIATAGMLDQHTGYIKLLYFHSRTAEELDHAIQELNRQQMSQLIIDLRDNQGGELNAAIEVVDRFLPDHKLIVYTKGRTLQANKRYFSTARRVLPRMPLIVLVNERTASDAEIFAGAMQDWDRGLIIGQCTFGKALVQTEYPLQDGSALLLTTAQFYTPLGRSIQREDSTQKKNVYRTPKGRLVKDGGGITPDTVLPYPSISLSDDVFRRLQTEGRFFETVDAYLQTRPSFLISPLLTAASFAIPDSLADAIHQRIAAGKKMNLANKIDTWNAVREAVAVELAGRISGDKGRYLLAAWHDPWVQHAIANFQLAKNLLDNNP
ncbi:S41 family peptidase [candidate division KSB1 bacterium]|nr:S41 family peptidase [candidate division KSB1 bacterium]